VPAESRDDDDGEHHRPHQVGNDQGAPLAHPVDPCTRRQTDDQERCGLRRVERAHLPRGRVQGADGVDRQGEHRELRAELAERIADPELTEVAVEGERATSGRGRRRGFGGGGGAHLCSMFH